ncbi:hypothetical protein VITU9109_14493 [Vibrio tubiashii ATCC 19109]|uniref:Uncharacterized protein n=1 Tax=Vibrio tubiashii ATCC 19109 TaxID=1051646 RepID=A0ABP2LI97_9VIBR|nr:hypothetical protein VITU9109_14493 [Vibrio tubiashii ATCC 19109]
MFELEAILRKMTLDVKAMPIKGKIIRSMVLSIVLFIVVVVSALQTSLS